ncbi:Linearmycin resistance ATP-binding protein LnrL [Phycisphaerales bacterium]|nr:Linearmycin resistance ATP-binding protein LnrL [Phycisphaerales bacterium]
MIEINSVTKRFGRAAAVERVNLRVDPGEGVALWGSNGAGKTTLIRCVLGLLPFEGTIRVGGFDVATRGKQARSLIGYVPQELGFYDDLRVGQAVRFFGSLKGLSIRDADGVLEPVGLLGHDGKRVRELSGGMKQRLALAIALLGDPPVLVLDEVTASLDACGRQEFVSLLERLAHSSRSLLFASHRVEEVGSLAKRVVLMEKGRVTDECPPDALVSRLGAANVLHLHLPVADRPRAIDLLRGSGFSPRLNGVGILVPVPPAQKAGPLRILTEAKISIEDFELLNASNTPRHDSEDRS